MKRWTLGGDRVDRAIGALSLSGMALALGVGAAVLVDPSLFASVRPWLMPLAAIGLLSTVGGYWWLGRRRR